ncbi:hypothetical protein F5Y10DRAFT_284394 [Nemania abortiva]|nr:hypothetical protein F5Y10DRAFT_284394 [Nemania abortiva]
MRMAPMSPAAPLKRRKKSQSKTWRFYENGQTGGEAAEAVPTPAAKTRCKDLRCQGICRITHQLDSESVTTARSVSTSSAPRISEAEQLPKEFDSATKIPEDSFTLDDTNLPTSKIQGSYLQPKITSAPYMHINPGDLWNTTDHENLKTRGPGEEAARTITTMDPDLSTLDILPPLDSHPDLNFGHSVSPTPGSGFSFYPGVEMHSKPSVDDWLATNCSSPYSSPGMTDQYGTQGSCYADFIQDNIFGINGNTSNGNDAISGSPFYRQLQYQDPPNHMDTAQPVIDDYTVHTAGGNKISTILPLEPAISSSNRCRKRSFHEQDRDDGENTRPNNCGELPTDNSGKKSLACPFYKRDPQRHQECGKYTLRRIKDVKQHIYRLHCKPELYCSRCYVDFKWSSERDHHIREGRCPLKEMPNIDGIITENQRKELKDCGSRGLSKEQHWMELWNIIFPGACPPRSPHIEDGQIELLSSLRSYWYDNTTDIIAMAFGEQELKSADYVRTMEIVDIILKHFEAKLTSWNLNMDREMDKESGSAP